MRYPKRLFSASEISDFLYCEEQYRLKKLEKKGLIQIEDEKNVWIDSRLEDGRKYHQQYSQRFRPKQKRAAKKQGGCAGGCVLFFILFFGSPFFLFFWGLIREIEFGVQWFNDFLLGIFLMIVVLSIVAYAQRRSKRSPAQSKRQTRPPRGDLIYSDEKGEGEILTDQDLGLTGKPDEVWRNGDKLHIVEVKSSSIPPHWTKPFYGHQMQLAVYMRLAQVRFNTPVESGEIRYADGRRFQFEWNDQIKRQLWNAIKRIRQVDATGRTFVKVRKTQCQKCRYYSVCEKKQYAK